MSVQTRCCTCEEGKNAIESGYFVYEGEYGDDLGGRLQINASQAIAKLWDFEGQNPDHRGLADEFASTKALRNELLAVTARSNFNHFSHSSLTSDERSAACHFHPSQRDGGGA
jgi:hypothetical protein